MSSVKKTISEKNNSQIDVYCSCIIRQFNVTNYDIKVSKVIKNLKIPTLKVFCVVIFLLDFNSSGSLYMFSLQSFYVFFFSLKRY